ncbi:glutathione S-transferase family protein [Stutzerimonas stutzeri]
MERSQGRGRQEAASPDIRAQAPGSCTRRRSLSTTGRNWLPGERYTVADAYLGVFAGCRDWANASPTCTI